MVRVMTRDLDNLKDLKREYLELVRVHGEDVAELKRFKRSLLEMNRRHRLEAVGMYLKVLAKIQKKVGGR